MKKKSVIKPACSGLAILAGSFSFIGSAQAVTLLSEDFEGGGNAFGTSTYNYSQNYTMPNLLAPGGGLTYMTGGAGTPGQVSTNVFTATGSPFDLLTGGITGAEIDASMVSYNLYAQFSTYFGQNDHGTLSVQFLDGASSPLGSPVKIGGAAFVSALGGGAGLRAWGADTLAGVVPPGARSASVQIFEVKTAGGTSIDGYMDNINISIAIEAVPISLVSASPPNNATGVIPAVAVSAVLRDGTPTLNNSSIQLSFDGSPVSPSIQKTGIETTVQYDPPGLLLPLSAHTYKIAFNKDGGAVPNATNEFSFTVASYMDKQLPAPIAGTFENFDGTPEGGLPAGWTVQSFADRDPTSEPAIDFTNLDSDVYTNFTVVEASRFTGTFETYSQDFNGGMTPPGEASDYQRVLSVNPLLNVVNGMVVSNLATGRFVFGNSGYRLGVLGQIMYLFSPDFDLTGKTNVYVSFHSLWEQNHDSLAALEYSIDMGTTWLPVVYMLQGFDDGQGPSDVLTNLDGTIDAVTTLTTSYADVAVFEGDIDGLGEYGAFIAVDPSDWPTLGPYISRRVNDDPVESKRVECFRLPLADNQAKVRFRFAHAGTDAWYWGIDDFGLYSLPPLQITSIVRSGSDVIISWPGAAGTQLQKSPSLSTPDWQDVAGSNGASLATVPITGTEMYFRLTRPF